MKYPNYICFRHEKYNFIDNFFEVNRDGLNGTVNVIKTSEELNKMYNPNFQLLITFGNDASEYEKYLTSFMKKRWNHVKNIENINLFNDTVKTFYMNILSTPLSILRIDFSAFTTCYNSYEKIDRAYNSLKNQTMQDWEWVVLDDSTDQNHFDFLVKKFKEDNRVRLYKRNENSGNIGNVKNEAVSLCRGKYVLELDHDDIILPDVFKDSVKVFQDYKDVDFIYMDYAHLTENGHNYFYPGNFFGLGYSGHYTINYNGSWIYAISTPNINNVTLSHIVSVPNHPRIWKKDSLLSIGNYNEFMPVTDDYELLLRTAVNLKMAKVHKLGYIQYMNNNNDNFSLIRNKDINILCNQLQPMAYQKYKISEKMKILDTFEDEKFIPIQNHKQIWRREDYEHKFCNLIVNVDYNKIYCIIGVNNLIRDIEKIKELYLDIKNDFILLDNSVRNEVLWHILESYQLIRIKCYCLENDSVECMEKYFHLLYKSVENFEFIK